MTDPQATATPEAGSSGDRIPRRWLGRDPKELAAIFVGGALGTLARAVLAVIFPFHVGHWPWPTFGVNIVGTVLLGYFTTRLQERLPFAPYRRPLLGTGVCGGLTTFSTMQVETVTMLEQGHALMALFYVVTSVAAGLLAIHLATAAVRRTLWRLR